MKDYWSNISALIGSKSRDFDKMKNGKEYNIYLHYCNGILQRVAPDYGQIFAGSRSVSK